MSLRVLIADDEAPARQRLRRLLASEADVEIVGEAASGSEAVSLIGALSPDVVLLDIQMPEMDGFDVIETVGLERMPNVVFVTAYDEHALQAFEVRALDYLLKPVTPDRLSESLERVRGQLSRADAEPSSAPDRRLEQLNDLLSARAPYLRRIMVQDDRGAQLLPVDAIEYARADRNYVHLHTSGGEFRLRGTIGALAERLDPSQFLRINRSDLVRLDAIARLEPWFHGDYRVLLRSGTTLMWSRRFRSRSADEFRLP